jgi:hypothetical protein
VIGPPIFVVQDTGYGTYNDSRGTFAYTLAGNTYSTLWNPNATVFFEGQVRLVRYILSNPAPVPIAVAGAYSQDPGGSWRAVERWTPFDAGGVPGSGTCGMSPGTPGGCAFSGDGFSFYDYWEVLTREDGGGCGVHAGTACGGPAQNVHWLGSRTQYECLAAPYWTSPVTADWTTFSSANVVLGFFQGPLQQGGEVLHPPATSTGMSIVPAANGNVPGTAVLYLTRPVDAPRTRSIAWNALSASNRYEAALAYFWRYETSHSYVIYRVRGCYYDDYRAHRGAAWLTNARDEVHGTLNLSTRGITGGTTGIGELLPQFTAELAGPIATH